MPHVFTGIGVHSGGKSTMTVEPCEEASGIVFTYGPTSIPARYNRVHITPMATTLTDGHCKIRTIEHVMAALCGGGISDAHIRIEGVPEAPIMDGSSRPFISMFSTRKPLNQPIPAVKILKPIEVKHQHAVARFLPAQQRSFRFHFDQNSSFYPYTQGKAAAFVWSQDTSDFARSVAPARTFGFLADGKRLQSMGFARGASLDNTLVLDKERIINPGGLNFDNEITYHKLLDAMGDIALWDGIIYGAFEGVNSNHATNNKLLHALARNKHAWQWL